MLDVSLQLIAIREGKAKDIYVVFSSVKNPPVIFPVSIIDDKELSEFVALHGGYLINKTGIKLRHQQLQDNGVYVLFKPKYMDNKEEYRDDLVTSKMWEMKALLEVKKELEGESQIYCNIPYSSSTSHDVLVNTDKSENTTAYICTASHTPSLEEIDRIANHAAVLEVSTTSDQEVFGRVNKVIPVVAGRYWKEDRITRATRRKAWRVNTAGGTYQIIRSFLTIATSRGRKGRLF